MQLVAEHEGNRVTVEQCEPIDGEAGDVAAFDGSRLIRLAACVFSCMTQPQKTTAAETKPPPETAQGADATQRNRR